MPITSAAKAALFAGQTDKVFLTLLTLTHPSPPLTLRFVNDNKDITSNGDLFIAFPFQIILPSSVANELDVARLLIDNIDRGITTSIRNLSTPATIKLEVVLSDDPNNIQLGPLNFTWRIAEWNATAIQGDLRYEELLTEPYPGDRVTPATFSGVF